MHPNVGGLCRFQPQEDRDCRHRWYVFDQNGTMVGRHPEGFAADREARLDAERLRERLATALIMGEVDEVTGWAAR